MVWVSDVPDFPQIILNQEGFTLIYFCCLSYVYFKDFFWKILNQIFFFLKPFLNLKINKTFRIFQIKVSKLMVTSLIL